MYIAVKSVLRLYLLTSGPDVRPVLGTDPDAPVDQTYLKYDGEDKFTVLKAVKTVAGFQTLPSSQVSNCVSSEV